MMLYQTTTTKKHSIVRKENCFEKTKQLSMLFKIEEEKPKKSSFSQTDHYFNRYWLRLFNNLLA